MSKSLLKIISLTLIFVLVAPMVNDAFRAAAVFAADKKDDKKDDNKEETGDLPLEKINREHFFRMVELCWPKYLQKLIRKLANTAIDKVIEGVLKLIPVIGGILGGIYDGLKVFRKMIDLPLYPSCSCMEDSNTQDSAWLPLNWRFAQNYIRDTLSKDHKPRIEKMEKNQHPMLVSKDDAGDRLRMDGIGNILKRTWDASSTYFPNGDPFVKISLSNFDKKFTERFPEYKAVISAIDEQQRLADNWRMFQPGVLKIMAKFHENIVFDRLEYVWTSAMLKDVFSNRGNRQYKTSAWGWYSTDKEKYSDNFDFLKDYDKEETQSAQTRALQAISAIPKATGDIVERNAYQWALFAEVNITAQQNKKSMKQAVHKNIDLMGHHTANKKISSKKVKLGFN